MPGSQSSVIEASLHIGYYNAVSHTDLGFRVLKHSESNRKAIPA